MKNDSYVGLTTDEPHPHGAEGTSLERLTGNYCRGKFEATACVERLHEYEKLRLTPEQVSDLKQRDHCMPPVNFGTEDEPSMRCRHCDENVTEEMEKGYSFCPYCGGRWLDNQEEKGMKEKWSEIEKLYTAVDENTDELDFFMELLEKGITVNDVRHVMGDAAAENMMEFCTEHGLL